MKEYLPENVDQEVEKRLQAQKVPQHSDLRTDRSGKIIDSQLPL